MEIGGILLTGGMSRRMGRDKATLVVNGESLAERTARLLAPFVTCAVEVGKGVSVLPAITEDRPGSGPLGAIVAGFAYLVEAGLNAEAPCLVLSCDLPRLTSTVLQQLAHWPDRASVLPSVEGMVQPLCARWSALDLIAAGLAYGAGDRSLRAHPNRSTAIVLDETFWGEESPAFTDIDTEEDLCRLGLMDLH